MTFDLNPNMSKQSVHNQTELMALIREAYKKGSEDVLDGTRWYTHEGQFICKSNCALVEFELEFADLSSTTYQVE